MLDITSLLNSALQLLEPHLRRIYREELNSSLSKYNIQVPLLTPLEKLMPKKEAAAYIGCSLPTLSKYVKLGVIPCHRLGNSTLRFKKSELDNCLVTVRNKKHNKHIDSS